MQLEPSTLKNKQSPAIQTLSKGFIFLKNNSVTYNEIYLYFFLRFHIYLKKHKYIEILEKIIQRLSNFTDAFLDVVMIPAEIIKEILKDI